MDRLEPAGNQKRTPPGGAAFDGLMVALAAWLTAGIYLDGWAHRHIAELDTFFTPYHGVLYAGYAAFAATLGITAVRNHDAGYPWRRALPPGYRLSLVGVFLYFAGGLGDLVWHTLLGVEVSIENLMSPTHLVLAISGALLITGPARAVWLRRATLGPLLLSLTFLLSGLTFHTQFLHPAVEPWAGRLHAPQQALAETVLVRAGTEQQPAAAADPRAPATDLIDPGGQAEGIGAVLVQTALLMGMALLALRRQKLPFGSLTLVFTLNWALMSVLKDQYPFIPVALLAGLAADLLVQRLDPSPERPLALRLFGFAAPVIFYALYFLALAVTEGVGWSLALWTGTVVLAGIVGLLLSYLVVPPYPETWTAVPSGAGAR